MRELWIWDKVLVASEVRKVSEKSWGTNGLMPTPPTEGCCLNPGVFGELKPQCWLAETILSGLISSISQWRVPHPMFSPFVVLWLVSSPNLSHCERAVFIMKGFSPSLSPSLSCSLAPTPILSPLCSALFAAAEVLLQDLSIDTTWCPPPPHPDFIMCWNLFLSTSSTWSLTGLYYSVCVGHVWWTLIIYVNIQL